MKKILLLACATLLLVSANAQKAVKEVSCTMSGLSAFLYMDLMELQKSDPTLKSIPDDMRERYVFHTINSELYVGAFADIKAEKRSFAAEYGVLFNGKEDIPFMTVNIPLKKFVNFVNSGIADLIEVGVKRQVKMDSARRVTHASRVNAGYQLPTGYCGKNVVVGIIDIGFDYTHRNFYDSTETTYRIKRVWDQNASSGTPPSGYNYGNELTTQSAILAAQKSHTNQTHGTHVAGMAAGGGSSESAMRKYKGMAPESDIVLVATTMADNDIIDGLRYILAYAQSVGKPCVVNMSLGGHIGSHDGYDITERNADNLFQNTYTKGAALMVSAGNEGNDPLHVSKTFSAQDSTLYTFPVTDNGSGVFSGYVDIWGTPGSNFRVKIGIADTSSSSSQLRSLSFPLTITTNSNQTSMVSSVISSGCTVYYATYTSYAYYNSKPRVLLYLTGSSSVGGRNCFIIKVESTSGIVHMWNNNGKFNGGTAGTRGNTNYTSNTIGSGNTSTMVASYNAKIQWRAYNGNTYQMSGYTIGARSPFSSIGPGLNTNLNKPEITAPGSRILSSYNKYDASYSTSHSNITHVQSTGGCWWGVMQGTSMACPATTGIVALWMEAYPELSWSQVKAVMRATAVTDSYTGTIPNNGSAYWGWGKIDAHRGIKYILSQIPKKPVPSPSSSTTICTGESITLTAPAGYRNYEWSNGATTRSITVSTAGTYKVRVDSVGGYFSPWSNAVTVTVTPYLNTTIAEGSQTICQGQTTRLSVGTAGQGTSYRWSTGQTSQSIYVTPNSTTQYWVTTNKLGYCPKTDTITVTVQPYVSTTVTPNHTICRGSSATLTVSGGTSRTWNTGATTNSITVSPNSTTTYTVTSNQSGRCSKTDTVTVTVQPYVSTSITRDTTICQGQSVTLTSTGGTSRRWSNNSTAASITVTPSSTTTYTATVNQNGYCSVTDTVRVTVQPTVATTITRDTNICVGQSVTLTSTGGTSRTWSNNSTSNSITVTPSSTTNYTVVVNQNGYCSKTDAVRVTVQPYVTSSITRDTTICQGQSITLTSTGGTSRTWSNNSTSASITVTPSNTTTYTATVNQNGYCSVTDTVRVTVHPTVATTISRDTAICIGQSVTLTSTGGTSRTWSNNSTSNSITVTPSSTTNYTVVVNQSGYCSKTDAVRVTVQPYVTSSITRDTTICQGQSITLTSTGGTSRTWSNNSTTPSITVTPSSTTTYTVTVNQNGYCSVTDTVRVTVQPTVATTITRDTTICIGQSVTLTSTGGTSRTWSDNSTSNSITVTPSSTTNYTVVVNQSGYCSKTDVVRVTVNPYVSTTISDDTIICRGQSVTLTSTGGTSRTWSNNSTTSSITVSPYNTTTYTVTSSAANYCSTTDTVTVTVRPYVSTTITRNTTICQGQSVRLTSTGGTSRTWSNGSTTQSITVTPPTSTTYSVTVNRNGYCSTTDTVRVTVNPYVTTTISNDTIVCQGQSVVLRVSGGTSRTWSTNQTTQNITVTPNTTTRYTVVSSQANHCSTTDTVTVTVKPYVATTITPDTNICLGQSINLSVRGGTSRTWNTGQTDSTINITPAVTTTYTVTSNAANQCSTTDTVTVTVRTYVSTTVSPDTIICPGETVTLTVNGGTSRTWSTGQTTPTIIVTPYLPTSYIVVSSAANQCSKTDTVEVRMKPTVVTTISRDTAICLGDSLTITISGGTSRIWNTGDTVTTFGIKPTTSTNYSVISSTPNLCDKYDTVKVTVSRYVNALVSNDTIVCPGEPVNLTANGGDSYLWLHGGSSQNLIVTPQIPSTYVVTIDSTGLCSVTDSITVNLYPAPHVEITGDTGYVSAQFATITAIGAQTYLWNTGDTTASITISPSVTTLYSVVGTNQYGCIDSASATVNCLYSSIITADEMQFRIYPNPVSPNSQINVEGVDIETITVYNMLGKKVAKVNTKGEKSVAISVKDFAQGVYVVAVTNAKGQTGRSTFIVR